MSKTVTIRLSDEEYQQIAHSAKTEHRPISNFITHRVLNSIEDDQEMMQIKTDKDFLKKLKTGHIQARIRRGKELT